MAMIRLLREYSAYITKLIFVLLVVLFLSYARNSPNDIIPNYALVSGGIYLLLLIFWSLSIRIRVIQKEALTYTLEVGTFLILFIFLRTIRLLLKDDLWLEQLIWHMYYIPIILIPLYIFLLVLSFDKKIYDRYHRLAKKILYLDFCVLFIIITNFQHQLVFKIIEWRENYEVISYQFGAQIVYAYLVMQVLLILLLLFYNSKLPQTQNRVLLPFFIFLAYLLYAIYYHLYPNVFSATFIEFPVMTCLVTVAFIESLILVGLVPSNSYYLELFENSEIPIMILDEHYEIQNSSKLGTGIGKNIYSKMTDGSVVDLFDSRVSMKAIDGGYVLWVDDISAINEKNEELNDANQALLRENKILEEELALKRKEIALREKKRIYDEIETMIAPKRLTINKLMNELNIKDDSLSLIRICLLGTYIKRISNIVLLQEMYGFINAIELENAIAESLLTFKLNHYAERTNEFVDAKLDGVVVKTLYHFFQEQLEYYFLIGCDLIVNWSQLADKFILEWKFIGEGIDWDQGRDFEEKLVALGVSLDRYESESSICFTIIIPVLGADYDFSEELQ